MPPSGPQRGTTSRRIRRVGSPSVLAIRRTHCRRVSPPSWTCALLRPIRLLKPPARMHTATERGRPRPLVLLNRELLGTRPSPFRGSFLRIDEDPVMDDDHEIVLLIASDVDDQ